MGAKSPGRLLYTSHLGKSCVKSCDFFLPNKNLTRNTSMFFFPFPDILLLVSCFLSVFTVSIVGGPTDFVGCKQAQPDFCGEVHPTKSEVTERSQKLELV